MFNVQKKLGYKLFSYKLQIYNVCTYKIIFRINMVFYTCVLFVNTMSNVCYEYKHDFNDAGL